MIKAVQFEFAHMMGFTPKDTGLNLYEIIHSNLLDKNREIVSLVDAQNKLVCLAGTNNYRQGTCEVWIIPGVLVDSNKLDFFKAVSNLVEGLLLMNTISRLELAVKKDWDKGYKWATKLGFEYEGMMRNYGPDGDYALFGRVK